MAGLEQFLAGLDQFNKGVQEYAIGQGIRSAQDQVSQINSQQMDEIQKRQALTQVGQGLAMHLAGVGAPATTIQAAVGAITPAPIKNSEDAYLAALQSGDKNLMDVATKAQKFETAPQVGMQESTQKFTAGENEKERANRVLLKQMDVQGDLMKAGAASKQMKPEDVTFKTNVDMGLKFVKDLRTTVAKNGTWESRLGDPDSAANLEGIPYQLAITYAKIVDPSSVAREGEVAAAQKYLIDLGPTASKSKVLKQLDHMQKTIQQYQQTRQQAQNLFPGGGSSTQPQGTPVKVKDARGNVIDAIRMPDGKLVRQVK